MDADTATALQTHWERRATVRARPRRLLLKNEGVFYPVSRQPLCLHPLVKGLAEGVTSFILIQSAYKFMWDIAQIETRVVNEVAEKIANDGFHIHFPITLKSSALTVLVDESYHAYVARDFMGQLENVTGIAPIDAVTAPTGLYVALQSSLNHFSSNKREFFQIIAIAIAENSITSDLIELNRERDSDINDVFYQVNQDHMADEARHSKIFESVLKYIWAEMTAEEQVIVARELPVFLREYLDIGYQQAFDRSILEALKLPKAKIDVIISDTHIDYEDHFQRANPVASNIVRFLGRAGVLGNKDVRQLFLDSGFEVGDEAIQ